MYRLIIDFEDFGPMLGDFWEAMLELVWRRRLMKSEEKNDFRTIS